MKILCEVSARHVHLSREHLEQLFGKDAKLNILKEVTQPGQFLSDKRVDLVTPKTTFKNVAILGPVRSKTQVEISRTDSFALGLKDVPLRQSGDLDNTPGITLRSGETEIIIEKGVIIARRHAHLDIETSKKYNITDKQIVSIKFDGERGGTLTNVLARVSGNCSNAIHIDTDEANALGFFSGTAKLLIKKTNK